RTFPVAFEVRSRRNQIGPIGQLRKFPGLVRRGHRRFELTLVVEGAGPIEWITRISSKGGTGCSDNRDERDGNAVHPCDVSTGATGAFGTMPTNGRTAGHFTRGAHALSARYRPRRAESPLQTSSGRSHRVSGWRQCPRPAARTSAERLRRRHLGAPLPG